MTDVNRRAGVRHTRKEVIHIEISAASHDQLDIGEVVSCATQDVSGAGLQIIMDRELPEGAILDLCVELEGIPRKFFLTAEVRWNRAEDDGVKIGFLLFDGEQTDIETWRGIFP
ncbi:MAG: PilZ domain-containing protein [Pseudomonadales bacterium]|nr:PilZ domain-containing protein [Pseudomonadales bacterium]